MKKLYDENNIRAIAEAIRAKNGTADTYKASEMADAINAIESGGDTDALMRGIAEDTITELVIPSGTTKISRYAFTYRNIESVTLPESVTAIGMNAFSNCTALESINLPSGLTTIDSNAFASCEKLSISSFPTGVTVGNTYALSYNATDIFTFHAGFVRVTSGFLSRAAKLHTVIFKGTPDMIAANTFANCDALTNIFVPWAETDAINANAPWGATNATIHYNYAPPVEFSIGVAPNEEKYTVAQGTTWGEWAATNEYASYIMGQVFIKSYEFLCPQGSSSGNNAVKTSDEIIAGVYVWTM